MKELNDVITETTSSGTEIGKSMKSIMKHIKDSEVHTVGSILIDFDWIKEKFELPSESLLKNIKCNNDAGEIEVTFYAKEDKIFEVSNTLECTKGKKYFMSYAAYHKDKTNFDLFNSTIWIDTEITSDLLKRVQEDLTKKLNEMSETNPYLTTQIIYIDKI